MNEQQQMWTYPQIDELIDKYIVNHHTPRGLVRRVCYEVRDDMQAALDAAQARIAELERERNYHIERANEMRETLQVLDETRSTCSAAWDEINSEVERINEADRLERLGG